MSTPTAPPPRAPLLSERDAEHESLWTRHREGGDPAARRALIEIYYPLVKHVARRVSAGLSDRVELCDLEGYGAEGLVEAIDRFEPGHGAQFSTFAAYRIRGAILDGIRAIDWAPRSVRRQAREIRENESLLSAELGRVPTEVEEARSLGMDLLSLQASKARIESAQLTSLEAYVHPAAEDREAPADSGGEPLAALLAREDSEALRAGLAGLSARQRAVTTLSYEDGMTLAEIGRLLGVTESRVCQIRSSAIRRLRESFLYATEIAG